LTAPQIAELVNGRARSAEIARRVLDFLRGAVALGNVEIGPGESERTRDGRTDYVMVETPASVGSERSPT